MKLKATVALVTLFATFITGFSSTAIAAGDATRGQTFYITCGACHGANGEGLEALGSPALAGQEEWYLIRQLQNFKSGIRGSDPRDIFGMQMAPMAMILPTDQAMEDVAAYISNLGD
jgi:cytochrome c553